MSLVNVFRTFSMNPVAVNTVLNVIYDLTLDGTGTALMMSFTDSSIGDFASSFSLLSVTDLSTGSASVARVPTNGTDASTPTSTGITFTSCQFDNPNAEDVCTLRLVFQMTASVVGSDWGAAWNPGEQFSGTFEDGGFGDGGNSELLTIEPEVCVAAGTLVTLSNGETKRIDDLRAGDVLLGENGSTVPLLQLLKMRCPTNAFQRIEADRFGLGCPERELLICAGHPIKIGNKVIMPENVSSTIQLEQMKPVFTLLTAQRGFVDMQGLLVATWSEQAWDNFVNNDPRAATLTFISA